MDIEAERKLKMENTMIRIIAGVVAVIILVILIQRRRSRVK